MPINRSSRFVKYNVSYKFERILDVVFLASPLFVLAFFAGAVYALWLGWMGYALIAAFVTLGAGVVAYGRYVAPWQLKVKRLRIRDWGLEIPQSPIPNPQSPPLRFVFFSDLHLARIKKRDWVQRVVDTANGQQPDVVLIGGDFSGVLGDNRFETLLEPLKHLHAPHGAYAILGNHDHAAPGENHVAELEVALPSVGVRLLRNSCVQLTDCVQLLTADELWAELDDVDDAFRMANVETARRAVSTKRVFMGHNPDLMLKMKPDHIADLFIFGHTHHGQIYIPFLPALAVPIRSRFYRGLFHTPNGPVYVSAGVGEGNSPIRINTWPEIVVFEL